MNGRGYLWVLSLQFFVIDLGTMTGRGYLWILSLQIFIIDHDYDWKRLFVGTLPANQKLKMHEQRIGSHRKPATMNWSP